MIRTEISARLHEEARVASAKLSLRPAAGLAALRDQVAEQLRISVRWAEETDTLIGHIKAYLQWGGTEAVMLSTTGGPVEVKGSPLPEGEPESAEVGITAIVFGPELEAVEDRLEGMAAAIAGQNGEWCTFVHECEHHHHHDHDHDHDHDGACGCGEHEHEHEHHHAHEHGHEHHHDHEHHHHHHDHEHEDRPDRGED